MLISETIDDALTKIGVKNPTDEADPKEHELGLRALNRIIDAYNIDNLYITHAKEITYPMPYNGWGASIEIGEGLEIDSVAPTKIQSLFWRQDGTDYPSKEMQQNQWTSIGWKTASGIPARHYVQQMDNNNIKIYFDLVPLIDLEMVVIATMPYLSTDGYLPTDDISWSYGFEKMLMYRLAVELSLDYEIEPSQLLLGLAEKAENSIKSRNYRPLTQNADTSLVGGRHANSSRNNRARY